MPKTAPDSVNTELFTLSLYRTGPRMKSQNSLTLRAGFKSVRRDSSLLKVRDFKGSGSFFSLRKGGSVGSYCEDGK